LALAVAERSQGTNISEARSAVVINFSLTLVLINVVAVGFDVMISKCEIAGIESELSAGHPIPASFVRGSNKGPKLGFFGRFSGVSLK